MASMMKVEPGLHAFAHFSLAGSPGCDEMRSDYMYHQRDCDAPLDLSNSSTSNSPRDAPTPEKDVNPNKFVYDFPPGVTVKEEPQGANVGYGGRYYLEEEEPVTRTGMKRRASEMCDTPTSPSPSPPSTPSSPHSDTSSPGISDRRCYTHKKFRREPKQELSPKPSQTVRDLLRDAIREVLEKQERRKAVERMRKGHPGKYGHSFTTPQPFKTRGASLIAKLSGREPFKSDTHSILHSLLHIKDRLPAAAGRAKHLPRSSPATPSQRRALPHQHPATITSKQVDNSAAKPEVGRPVSLRTGHMPGHNHPNQPRHNLVTYDVKDETPVTSNDVDVKHEPLYYQYQQSQRDSHVNTKHYSTEKTEAHSGRFPWHIPQGVVQSNYLNAGYYHHKRAPVAARPNPTRQIPALQPLTQHFGLCHSNMLGHQKVS